MDRQQSEAKPVAPLNSPEGSSTASRGASVTRLSAVRSASDDRESGDRSRLLAAPRPATEADDRPPADASDHARDALLDVSLLFDYGYFALHAVQRHLKGAIATLVLTMAAVTMVANAWPKTFQIDGRLLVAQGSLVSSLVNPERAMSRDIGAPTIGAQEIVESRDNLLSILTEMNLLDEWERTRKPLLRLKDSIFRLFLGAPTQQQRIDGMIGLIEERLQVGTSEEGTVSFVLKWPDAEMGRQIVEKAMRNFLEHRRVTETAAITDSIAILDKSAETIEGQVRATLGQLPRERMKGPAPRIPQPVISAPSGPSAEATVRLARLRSALDERRQEVARLDGVRTQQLADAQTRLSAALAIYTDGHPSVAALRQNVQRLASESAELAAARRDVRSLEADYDALSTSVGTATATAEQQRMLSQMQASAPVTPIEIFRPNNSETDPIGLRLKNQMSELATVHARASAARAELASLQAGFKYQYSVVRPPQLPREPLGPNVVAMLGAGLIASLLLALAFAVSADLAGGRVLEAWQVERQVRAPIAMRIPTL